MVENAGKKNSENLRTIGVLAVIAIVILSAFGLALAHFFVTPKGVDEKVATAIEPVSATADAANAGNVGNAKAIGAMRKDIDLLANTVVDCNKHLSAHDTAISNDEHRIGNLEGDTKVLTTRQNEFDEQLAKLKEHVTNTESVANQALANAKDAQQKVAAVGGKLRDAQAALLEAIGHEKESREAAIQKSRVAEQSYKTALIGLEQDKIDRAKQWLIDVAKAAEKADADRAAKQVLEENVRKLLAHQAAMEEWSVKIADYATKTRQEAEEAAAEARKNGVIIMPVRQPNCGIFGLRCR